MARIKSKPRRARAPPVVKNTAFGDLPRDVQMNIFGRLDAPREVKSAASVSKDFRNTLRDTFEQRGKLQGFHRNQMSAARKKRKDGLNEMASMMQFKNPALTKEIWKIRPNFPFDDASLRTDRGSAIRKSANKSVNNMMRSLGSNHRVGGIDSSDTRFVLLPS